MIYLQAFLVTLVSVGLKANQNLSVVYGRWGLIPPTSIMLAVVDYLIINMIVTSHWTIIIATGLGGAAGCFCSISFDRYWRRTHPAP